MKPFFVSVLSALLAPLILAKPAQKSFQADGFQIMLLHDNEVSVEPVPNDMEDLSGGPYFIRIEIAKSEQALEDPAKCTKITQGIAPNIKDHMPIELSIPVERPRVIRVTVLSDACFSGWKKTRVFRVSAKGIIEMKTNNAEQPNPAQPATQAAEKEPPKDQPSTPASTDASR